ncbi:MAG: inositol monophosphatase [Proteobacteria bacterium]|nr:inositol monophosphatase [Pseudomonadota bacterium]MBU1738596.1 inositol monophosphatase [Pseudomonadota bacterium]
MDRVGKVLDHCTTAISPMLRAAVEASSAAGEIIRELYDQPHQIRMKGAIDLVTEADLAAEKAILEILSERFPHHSFMGEESSSDQIGDRDGSLWIIDPLDGTTNFAHGFPYFCVSIAYQENGRCEAGVINCPMQNEIFLAWRGGGAYLNGRKISVSQSSSLLESLIATGFPYSIEERIDRVLSQFGKVLPKVRDIRRAGAAALDLAYVACGRLDGFWEMDLKPWDTAAGVLMVEEAGGRVTDFAGSVNWTPYMPEVVASNGRIHLDLVSMLS